MFEGYDNNKKFNYQQTKKVHHILTNNNNNNKVVIDRTHYLLRIINEVKPF